MTTTHMIQRPGVTLCCETIGTGPPVLLIQGVGVSGEGWRPQMRGLADRFQLATYDNRGLGQSQPCEGPITIESMTDDALAVIETLGWSSAHVVGHSMGGVIAQQLALDHPQRVRSLSLLCTFARGKDAARITPWILWMTLRTRIGTRAMRRRAFLEMILPPSTLAGADSAKLAAELAPLIGRDLADQPPILMRQLKALTAHDASARLNELAGIRTQVISAGHDAIAYPATGRALADAIPGATFELIPAASHAMTIHMADEINGRLARFITSCDAANTMELSQDAETRA